MVLSSVDLYDFVRMGAAVSCGQNNDELVDNLMASGYIRTRAVERVFRAVDRADYVLPYYKDRAYNDVAWKFANLHLSAPCIYGEVMESLVLQPGMSFLNLGSGTGYLSTMAGLILTQHGTNHGIELYKDCLLYAYQRLEEFKRNSLALDEFDFCEPVFIPGNCLSVTPGRQYDRVYCGAACPESYVEFIKQFVRIGGILVVPFIDHLLRVLRVDENTWVHIKVLPVSFTPLVVPTTSEQNLFDLPECVPLSLQELCKRKIRCCLRENVWKEHDDLVTEKLISLEPTFIRPPQQTLSRCVIPVFGESDESISNESVSDEDDEFRGFGVLLSIDSEPRDRLRASSYSKTKETNSVQNASNSTAGESPKDAALQFLKNAGETSYLNIFKRTETLLYSSESDSEAEQDETPVQRKKVAKREKTDSGIVEDVNINNKDSSSRSSSTSSIVTSSSSTDSADTANAMDYDEEAPVAHYVNSVAFSSYLKEKIHQLPLPPSLKLFLKLHSLDFD